MFFGSYLKLREGNNKTIYKKLSYDIVPARTMTGKWLYYVVNSQ